MKIKEQILLLLSNTEEFVSGEELSERFQVSRTAVWKNINALREAGYEIESVTNRGYRLISRPDLITEEELHSTLHTGFTAKKIYFLPCVDSTNKEAKRQALVNAPNGSLFIAEEQQSGKGRLGRNWSSPAGTGLWFTLLLRPQSIPQQVTLLTLLAGLAVSKAIRAQTGCDAKIKWPNDVVIGSKKVCGILTEMAAEMERINYVIIGIGINVNQKEFPEELRVKATSLLLESGKPFRRTALLQEVLTNFETLLSQLKSSGPDALLEDYKKQCISLNRTVGFTRNGQPATGTAIDISREGELIVRCENGETVPVFSGEVTVQGIYGQ